MTSFFKSPGAAAPVLCAAAVFAAAGPGAATPMSCTFETECFEAETCAEADLLLEVLDGSPRTVVSEFGDFAVEQEINGSLVASGSGMLLLLTRSAEGDARATFHLEGPVVATYLGACQDSN